MAQNGLSLGPDFQFGIYDGSTGAILAIGDVQSVKITKHNALVTSKPYNGPPRFAHVPDGYSGSFSLVRTSSSIEILEIARDGKIYAGSVLPVSFLNETVTNPDGTVTTSQFTNLDWYLDEEADVSKDKTVPQTIQWHASQKVLVA